MGATREWVAPLLLPTALTGDAPRSIMLPHYTQPYNLLAY